MSTFHKQLLGQGIVVAIGAGLGVLLSRSVTDRPVELIELVLAGLLISTGFMIFQIIRHHRAK